MRIDLEKLNEWLEYEAKINQADIEDLEFYEGGEKIDIPAGFLSEFVFTGLSNICFITTRYYRQAEWYRQAYGIEAKE